MNDDPATTDRSADVDADPDPDADGVAASASGLVEFRKAIVGLGLIWLAAVAAFGTVLAAVYGLTVSAEYLIVSAIAAGIAVAAALGSLRTFGYR